MGEPTHFEIGVPDVERAYEFYGKLLGWRFHDTGHGAWIETPGMRGGIHPDEEPNIELFFGVPDVDAAVTRLLELGGEIVDEEGHSEGTFGRYVWSCRDDQGVPFGLHEPAAE